MSQITKPHLRALHKMHDSHNRWVSVVGMSIRYNIIDTLLYHRLIEMAEPKSGRVYRLTDEGRDILFEEQKAAA